MSDIDKIFGDNEEEVEEELPLVKHVQYKIQKYKLEEDLIYWYMHDDCTIKELVKRCNTELDDRKINNGDKFPYQNITHSNVNNYLSKIRDKITMMRQDQFEQAIAGVGVIDKVRHLQGLVHSGYERGMLIKDRMIESFEKRDDRSFFAAVNAAKANDSQVADVLKSLAMLEGKLSTYVTVDYVKTLTGRIVDKIATDDHLDPMHKHNLILSVHQCIDLEDAQQTIDTNFEVK